MFSRKQAAPRPASKPGKAGPPGLSFVGSEVVINGDVTTTAQLHVDGRIDGHVRCKQLCQGGSGVISGDIVADEARIAGLVQGTVTAATVIVEASARVTGDITYETVSIAAGARIDGRMARKEALAASESPAVLIATPAVAAGAEPDAKADPKELFPAADRQRVAAG